MLSLNSRIMQQTLSVHVFGKFRRLATATGPTDNSIVNVPFVANESVAQLLGRMNINSDEIGELFVEFKLASLETRIPAPDSRVALFPEGMSLIDGGQHMKGHGYITTRRDIVVDYY